MFKIEKLYMQYKKDIYIYLMSLTHNPLLSEDLLSETFLGAIKSLPAFKGNSDIKTWLFSIARYKWFEYLRKEKKDVSFDDLAMLYITEGVDDKIVEKKAVSRIIELLDCEEKRSKDIVLMRINGYSYYDIALKYQISEGSARVIDFRTKRRIKEILIKEEWNNE
ncbi:MAG TPA: RNA polymerase subunit sigma-24 [Clostridiales bacterium]|nr:RNA polymerase subunit sigma-24 [Clostridiales bacterium]